MMEIKRNDKCPCGNGKKYKNCHLRRKFNPYLNSFTDMENEFRGSNLHEKNLLLVDAVKDVFGLTRGSTLFDLKKNISNEQITELYKIIGTIWPRDIDIYDYLPTQSPMLAGLYNGDVYPDMIIKNITRFSLYSDKIFIINPFLNAWTLKKEYNPIFNPEYFKADTLKLVYFTFLIEPWLRAGLIELLPYIGDYDKKLFLETLRLAEERLKDTELLDEEIDDYTPYMEGEVERFILNLPDDTLSKQLRGANPKMSDEKVRAALQFARNKRENDPLSLDQPKNLDEISGQYNLTRIGGNLETILYVCQITGAFPFTNLKYRWKELLLAKADLNENSKIWTPLTKAFQQLDFNFLNNVDSKFALEIRKEGRLESFRKLIRRIWNELEGSLDFEKSEILARDFSDELKDEYNKAEAEWIKIKSDLIKWTGGILTGGIIAGGISIEIGTAGLAMGTVSKLIETHYRKKQFRKSVPMSMFMDLSKHKK